MANCITCGRALPPFTFGRRSEVCDTCRATAVEMPAPGTMPAPAQLVSSSKVTVTTVLVGMNVAVFVLMVLSGVSFVNPTIAQLLRWGANAGPFSFGGEPWRILVSTYLHGGIIHIAFNMWCLWSLGQLAERIFDRLTYVLIYTACGIAASLTSLWWHPMEVSVGASGAIFGLAGALIAALYLGKLPVPKAAMQGTLKSLLSFAAYNLIFGAAIKIVDNSAHIGGLVAGLILGTVLAKHLNSPKEDRNRWRLGVFALTAVLLVLSYQWVRQSFLRSAVGEQGRIFQPELIFRVPLRNPAKSMTTKG